jgi:hypothetical protein
MSPTSYKKGRPFKAPAFFIFEIYSSDLSGGLVPSVSAEDWAVSSSF